MKKIPRISIYALLFSLMLVLIYSLAVVFSARAETDEIVNTWLQSEHMKLELSDFQPERLQMVLAVEDPNFYNHNGMDLSTPGAGMTTITQGLVKYLYFKDFTPGVAKLKQTLIAVFALDALVSKDQQLLLMVNTVNLGQHQGKTIRGFGSAAEAYFKKSFSELNDDEFLALLAMVISPNHFHILDRPAVNAERVRRIKLLLSGEYRPAGLMDLYYDQDKP